jgi:hypothetical protein
MSLDSGAIRVLPHAELRKEPSYASFAWRFLCVAVGMDAATTLIHDSAAVFTERRRPYSMTPTFFRNLVNRCRERRHQRVTKHLTPLEARKRLVTPARRERPAQGPAVCASTMRVIGHGAQR